MNDNKGLKIYHGQATRDRYAEKEDFSPVWLATTTMKEIKEAYKEFMQDLLIEAQEAY